MTIKEIEAETGLPRANVRYYESEGLITPERKENGYRVYSREDAQELMKIKLLRQLGLSVETIKALQQGNEDVYPVQNNQCLAEGNKETYEDLIKLLVKELGYQKIIIKNSPCRLGKGLFFA